MKNIKKNGFTLVELLTVIVILAIVPSISKMIASSTKINETNVGTMLSNISNDNYQKIII
jgi:prepilin-type N-terminal cleavage/methylation domain-containing protein